MLEANEINPNVSEDKLTMEVDDEEEDSKVNKTSEGEKILKGLTMEVIVSEQNPEGLTMDGRSIIFYTLEVT